MAQVKLANAIMLSFREIINLLVSKIQKSQHMKLRTHPSEKSLLATIETVGPPPWWPETGPPL
jgi:hypothetical protein